MKIFVACQKDAFNKSCNATQKKYEIGQALIDAMSEDENVLLIMETHRSGNYCVHDKEGWELIDELQAVIEVLDDKHLEKLIAIESPSLACFDIINAIRCNQKENMEIEFIGPLLDLNIFHNIILVYNAFPGVKIKLSKRRCGCTNKIDNEHILEILEKLNVEIEQ
jgi:hypothetical protein